MGVADGNFRCKRFFRAEVEASALFFCLVSIAPVGLVSVFLESIGVGTVPVWVGMVWSYCLVPAFCPSELAFSW